MDGKSWSCESRSGGRSKTAPRFFWSRGYNGTDRELLCVSLAITRTLDSVSDLTQNRGRAGRLSPQYAHKAQSSVGSREGP